MNATRNSISSAHATPALVWLLASGLLLAIAANDRVRAGDAEAPPLLSVAGYFDDENVVLFLRFPTDNPSWYHQYWVFRDGQWVRYGSGTSGPDEHGFYEDRISVMWDDGSVDGFAEMGGYTAVHGGMRHTRSEVSPERVREHPYFGEQLGRTDVRKFIRESRDETADGELWENVKSEDALEALRKEGRFLDLWQWRAHRSNPVGFADNGYVLEYRHGSAGRAMYTTNEDPELGGPQMMFDSQKTGFRALCFDKLVAREYGQDDRYFLEESFAVSLDLDHEWQNGDALPHRLLQGPDGSRGAIRAEGRHSDGAWRVRLTRSLESPNPMDSISFVPGETYTAAFAVHTGSVGGADHWVSPPVNVGFAADAQIRFEYIEGERPAEADLDWQDLQLFRPADPTAP